MRCFELWVNGRRLYTAGLPFPGHLHGHLVSRQAPPNHPLPEGRSIDHFRFRGIDANGDSVFWPMQPLQVGDEVIIRVVEMDTPDDPTDRRPRDDAEFERIDRKVYEQMKQKFETSGPAEGSNTDPS